jgi:FkbM family methyltransferase
MYSQNNEEQIVIDYFKGHIGTFADIGSNDGITLSNTFELAQRGWTGVCVEADPAVFKRLEKNYSKRKDIYLYNWGIGEKTEVKKFWQSGTHLNKGDIGLVSTFDPQEKLRWVSAHTKFTEIDMQMYTWAASVNQFGLKTFEFINIDVEGGNLEVLDQISKWSGFSDVKCICVEWNGKQKNEFTEICKDFKLIGENPENLIFAR